MLNAEIVKDIYETKYFNWDELKNYNKLRISPSIIKWDILADLISSKERLFILIFGNPHDHYWELEQFADMINYMGGHICLNPFQCISVKKEIDELSKKIDNYKNEDSGNLSNYESIESCLDNIEARVYDVDCHLQVTLYEQADVILVFNTDNSVKDEVESFLCMDDIDSSKKKFYKVICERDEGVYDKINKK